MIKMFFILLGLPLFTAAQYTYKNLDVNFLTKNNEAVTYTFGNLRLYPVSAKESLKKEFATIGKYMTLKDAIEKKKVKITESGGVVQ